MSIVDRLLAEAASQVGVTEHPLGSNRGPQVDRYQLDCGPAYLGTPWCAEFQHWVRHHVGLDPAWVSPATSILASEGKRLGYEGPAVPGGLICWPGVHVEMITRVHPGGVVETIGGNVSDGVRREIRSTAGTVLLAEPAVRQASAGSSDAYEVILVLGLWRARKLRDRALARMKRADRAHAAPVRVGNRYGIRLLYGPWPAKHTAEEALQALRRRWRPHSSGLRAVQPHVQASGLGKVD